MLGIHGNRGAALLVALWLLALLSAIAVGIAGTTRTQTHLTRNLLDEARARHLAQAGIYHTVALLLDEQSAPVLPPDGRAERKVPFDGGTVRVRLRDECGKVDVNTGWGGLMLGLLLANRVDEAEALSISQAILDWRDPDQSRRPRGAEDKDYAAAGLAYGARDGVMEMPEEIQQVIGVSPVVYRRLAPDITVDCLRAGIEPLAATPAVLAAIPGADPTEIERFLRARREAAMPAVDGGEGVRTVPPFTSGGKYVEPSIGQVYEITATAGTENRAAVRWQAVVWLTGDATRPYVIRAWRRGPSEPAGE